MRWLVLLALLVSTPALADPEETVFACDKKPGEVAVTFKPDTEVKELITWAMGFTCNQFLYDPRFVNNRHIVLMAPEKMTPHDAYELFLASLATTGLAVVRNGKAWEIVENQAAKHGAIAFVQHPGDGSELVRFVVHPVYAKPDALAAALESLRSDAGEIKQTGALLVITDHAAHVQQMLALAKQLDVPSGSDGIYLLPLLHADGAKLQSKLADLLGKDTKIVLEDRTNTLIVAGSEAAYERVRALVERVDIPLEIEGGASIHVYQLGNAVAEEVAKTLNDAIQRQQGGGAGSAAAAAKADGPSLEGQVHVIADAKSNKLIVTASTHDFLALEEVIAQLDEPRRQVFIETVILTVENTDGLDLGTSSHGAIPTSGGSLVLGGVQTGPVSTLDVKDTVSNATGLLAGVLGPALTSSATFLGTSIPSYGLLFTAIASTSSANSVSTPSIIAVDNETTKFHVGQNVPYKRGVVPISSTSPLSGTTTNIDRQDLNFELDIKPHISANDNVMLEITNDAKEYGTNDPELGPSWNTRGFETRVVVHDQQTIVLTGLTQEHEEVSTNKVPILGDIPLLGYAFKYHKRSKKRSNTLILMTPYIIKDQLDLQQILERKTREHDEFVASFRTLDHMPYIPRLDYRKKRGLVEEINRAVEAVDEDAAARATLHDPVHVKAGAVE